MERSVSDIIDRPFSHLPWSCRAQNWRVRAPRPPFVWFLRVVFIIIIGTALSLVLGAILSARQPSSSEFHLSAPAELSEAIPFCEEMKGFMDGRCVCAASCNSLPKAEI